MKNKYKLTVVVLASLIFIIAIYYRPWQSKLNVAESAHGIAIPPNARNIVTTGNWRRGFLDRYALTKFTIDVKEALPFTNSLPVVTNLITCVPGKGTFKNGKDIFNPQANSLERNYSCTSTVGDFMHVTVKPVSEAEIGVTIYTDWN